MQDGEWEPPMIPNPEYKGEWSPKQIDNKDYKGIWQHPEIDNPEYTADPNLYLREDIGVVGLDLWQVKSGTIFSNFLLTDDIEYAKEVAAGVKATQDGEKKVKDQQDEEERKKAEAEAKASEPPKQTDDEEIDEDDDDEAAATGEATPAEEHDEL